MAAVPAVTQTSKSHRTIPSTQIVIGPDSATEGGKDDVGRLKLDLDWTDDDVDTWFNTAEANNSSNAV